MTPIRWFGMTLITCCLADLATTECSAQTRAQFDQAREQMVQEVIIGSGIKNPRVIEASRNTERHEFVPRRYHRQAYFDMALPIGEKQTISSPFIVAFMTETLDPQPTDRVLEIGTGSGYQAAILSPLVKEAYSIEIVPELGQEAARTLKRLGYKNVFTKVGDGFLGWEEHAPFDKIIVTCSPEKVPQPLIDQLREGGRMVIPVGERFQQTLYLFIKENGKLKAEALRPTLFVPMTGEAEDKRQVKPNPLKPVVVNGNFEAPVPESGHLAGWYYQRQYENVQDESSPEGKSHVRFTNLTPGRVSRALQGFAVDGRGVAFLEISAWVKTNNVLSGRAREELPMIAISLYDEERRDLGESWLGPWSGTEDWRQVSRRFRIPPQTRSGILRIGLFGGIGEVSFDDIQFKAVPR